MMTVKQLINELSKYNQDLEVENYDNWELNRVEVEETRDNIDSDKVLYRTLVLRFRDDDD